MIYNKYACKEFIRVTETDCTYIARYIYIMHCLNFILLSIIIVEL